MATLNLNHPQWLARVEGFMRSILMTDNIAEKCCIVWDYVGCKVFQPGDKVLYRRFNGELQYMDPVDLKWVKSMHDKIPIDRAKDGIIYWDISHFDNNNQWKAEIDV